MPRKDSTHARILMSASRLLRGEGPGGASVARVMRGAGLTVGGFYAHFRSKAAMDGEALRRTLAECRSTWFSRLENSSDTVFLLRVMRRYLSATHRDQPELGCPLPASISELGRAADSTRTTLAEELEKTVARIQAQAPLQEGITPRERALATLALAVGGLSLARALRGHSASDEMLQACIKWAVPEVAEERALPLRQAATL